MDFFFDTSPITTPEALLEHLLAAFASGEDKAAIKSEFYGREQFSKDSEDNFAEALQLLSRKILMVNPNFRPDCNSALINQFVSGLHDDIMRPLRLPEGVEETSSPSCVSSHSAYIPLATDRSSHEWLCSKKGGSET